MAFNFNGAAPKKILYNGLKVAKVICNGVVVWIAKVLSNISGALPLTLNDCTGDDLNDYKIYGNSRQLLPDGYTAVEYLESTGTQYIDTGVTGNLNTEVIIKANKVTASSQDSITVFGDGSNNSKAITINLPTSVSNKTQRFGDKGVVYNTPLSLDTEYVFKANKSGLYVDGEKIITFNADTDFTTDYNLRVFQVRGISGAFYNGTSKVYYCKIYNDGVLVRNFVPCIDPSDVAGMYDTVNDVFYANAGTGTFNAGNAIDANSVGDVATDTSDSNYGKYCVPILTNSTVTKVYLTRPLRKAAKLPSGYTEVEHIESTGTQYIDTGMKLDSECSVEADLQLTAVTNSGSALFGSRTSATENNFEAIQGYNVGIATDFQNYNTNRLIIPLTYNRIIIKISKELMKIGNATKTNISYTDFETPSNAYIFNASGVNIYGVKAQMKLYSFKIQKNNVLVRNFVPCYRKSDNVIGLYDTVNDVFYTNAGTGSFIAGADVETVYYTDYLDYENQKVVRNVSDDYKPLDTPIEESIVLPSVPIDEGTVIVDVGTQVTPSYATVKYYHN